MQSNILRFTWFDYLILCSMFGLSVSIGIYFGCCKNRKASTHEYLLGSRNISMFPIAMSLIASHVSGITLLGGPSEVYFYGTQYWTSMFAGLIFSMLMLWIFLPVFYELRVTSSYQYLSLRFNNHVRSLAILMYIVNILLYVPIVVYIPALAFSQVSGASIQQIAPIICTICIFYTTIGGLRGVVWNDAMQLSFSITSLTVISIMGVSSEGGFSEIWKRSKEGNRIEFFNLDLDPTERTTLWGSVFGSAIFFLSSLGVNPATVQRISAVSSVTKAKLCMFIFGTGIFVVLNITSFFGLMMYARYYLCDPYRSGIINKPDQIVPFYVTDLGKGIPGVPGLFMTSVFCTALSTMSTHLNTVSGTIYTDFLDIYLPGERSDVAANAIIKITVVLTGVLSTALIFVIERLGGVLEICFSFAGISTGPLLGLFTMGMIIPCIDSKGALIGSLVSWILMAWIVIGNQVSIMNGSLRYDFLPTEISGCTIMNSSYVLNYARTVCRDTSPNSQLSWMYRISFYWYTLFGTIVSIVVALVCSKLLRTESSRITNRNMYSPIIRRFLKNDIGDFEIYNLNT